MRAVPAQSHEDVRGLVEVLAARRMLVDQAIALGVFLAACVAWRLAAGSEPEPFVGVLLAAGGVALLVVLALAWAKSDDAALRVDEVILAGGCRASGRGVVQDAVDSRRASIGTPRARRRLARSLRSRLALVESTAPATSMHPHSRRAWLPLTPEQRQIVVEERALILSIAESVEQRPVDPRALVLAWQVITCWPPAQSGAAGEGELLRRRLRAAAMLTDQPVPEQPPIREAA